MAHRDTCAKGHRYTEANTAWRANGVRRCRICDRFWREARKARLQLRAEAVTPQQLSGQEPVR